MNCTHQNEQCISDTTEVIYWCANCGSISIAGVGEYNDRQWRLSNPAFAKTVHGPTTPRYWGVLDEGDGHWLQKPDGEVYYYPSAGVAQAHLETYQSALAHMVNGRGHSVTDKLVVKEMTATSDGP